MISGSETMACMCNEVRGVFIDGTLIVVQSSLFKCTIYVHVHGLNSGHGGHYFPLVFMFLPRKSESSYRT